MHSRQQREYKNCTYNAYITRLSAISPIAMKAHRVSRLHARQRNLQRRLRNSKASRAKDLPAASGTKLRRMWEQRRFSRKLLFPPLSLSLSAPPPRARCRRCYFPTSHQVNHLSRKLRKRHDWRANRNSLVPEVPPGGKRQGAFKNFSNLTPS